MKFAELSAKAGFPKGVINILPGSGKTSTNHFFLGRVGHAKAGELELCVPLKTWYISLFIFVGSRLVSVSYSDFTNFQN